METNANKNKRKRFRKVGRSEQLAVMVSELAAENCTEITRILPINNGELFVEFEVEKN